MMRLAVRTLRHRKSGFIATFVAVVFGTGIVMACGGLMETGIRSNVEPQRLAATSLVVTGNQSHLRPGAEDATPLPERVGVPAELVAKIRSVQGVSAAIGDLTFPAVGAAVAEGHNWSSAALAPYKLISGHAPSSGQVVMPGAKVGSRITFLIGGEPKTFTVSGSATGPAGHAFFADREAAHLAGSPTRFADVGVLVAPGTNVDDVRDRIKALDGNITARAGIDR
ncbi:MAG TPA: ABC transporter permease, partial [Kribbella sp.]|nr:ABC transporter permease [Kribbella sp.]